VRRRDEWSRAGPARETRSNPAVAIAEDSRASGHGEAVATGESRPGASREWSRMAMAASAGERRCAADLWERDPRSDAA